DEPLQGEEARSRKPRTAPQYQDPAYTNGPRQSALLRRSAHTVPLQRSRPLRIFCSIHRRRHYRQRSRKRLNSFSISRGAKTLRSNLVRAVTQASKESSSCLNERCGAANVTCRTNV